MSRRLGIALVVVVALGSTPSNALASSRDTGTTHTYLIAAQAALQAVINTWPKVQASIHALNDKLSGECLHVGEAAPQNEIEQEMSYEVAGALWATGYHIDAAIVRKFVASVKSLTWSNPAVTHAARRYNRGLQEMVALTVPNLCSDVRAWTATGYATVPADVLSYDKHVRAIDVKEPQRSLFEPYLQSSDKALVTRVERLNHRFEELEITLGFNDWNVTLETLALGQ
jgi:hypothetical protein